MFSLSKQSSPDFEFICFEKYLKMIRFILCVRRLHLFFPILQRSFCKMPNKSIYLSKLLLSLNVVACGNRKKYICIFYKRYKKRHINKEKTCKNFSLSVVIFLQYLFEQIWIYAKYDNISWLFCAIFVDLWRSLKATIKSFFCFLLHTPLAKLFEKNQQMHLIYSYN